MQPITVVIADRSRARRVACIESLRRDGDIRVVAESSSSADAIEAAVALAPSILVCSVSLAAALGHRLLKALRRECPATRILLVTEKALRRDRMATALAFGPLGFVARNRVGSHLTRAIRGVERGEAWVPRQVLGMFVERALRREVKLS